MARKPSRAVFLSKELEDSLKRLDPDYRFNRWVADMKSVLKENMFAGECIGKKWIPKHYARRYGVNNLYRMITRKVFDPAIRSSCVKGWAYAR